MIGNLRRPSTTEIAVKQVTFDRLAKAGRATGDVHFPSRSEVQCTSHGIIHAALAFLLQCLHVALAAIMLCSTLRAFRLTGIKLMCGSF